MLIDSRVHLRAFKRLQQIDREIRESKYPNSKTLAVLLEVNERTVKRDLATMRDRFHAPLIYDGRKRGFRYAAPGWNLPLERFTEGELLAFFVAENALRLVGHAPEAQLLRRSLGKLAALLPEQVSADLLTLGENTNFQNSPFAAVDWHILQRLAQAAAHQQIIEFDYYSPHNQELTHRRAEIHLLHNFMGDWFAVSYDRAKGEMRDFHAGRISNLKETNEFFDRQQGWNAEDYLKRGFFMMRGGRLTTVEIIFDCYQAQWIREGRSFHPAEIREELPNGEIKLQFQIGEKGLEAVARFCLTYAGHCRVMRPAKLKNIVCEKLRKGLEMNR